MNLVTRSLATNGGLAGLAKAEFLELSQNKELGEDEVSQVMPAFELGKRLSALSSGEYPVIASPLNVADPLTPEMALLTQESLRVLLLNIRNHVLSASEVLTLPQHFRHPRRRGVSGCSERELPFGYCCSQPSVRGPDSQHR